MRPLIIVEDIRIAFFGDKHKHLKYLDRHKPNTYTRVVNQN